MVNAPQHRLAIWPSVAGGAAALLVALAIWVGSRGLRYFDAALVGYATATVFLAFGVVYRYAVWVSSPPARRYLRRGWQAFFSWRNFRSLPTAVPRSVLGYLGFQTFLRARGRWVAHQLRASVLIVAARSPVRVVCRSAAAKCSLQTTMALVAAPSSTRCSASQPPPATPSPRARVTPPAAR
jgi:hypothetical protein